MVALSMPEQRRMQPLNLRLVLLIAVGKQLLSSALKIAFVGDSGMEDESNFGYGHLTMKMIENQGVDLVIDVGDFDYWGSCSESYNVTQSFQIASTFGRVVQVPSNAVLKRFKWQDGKHKAIKGWEVGIRLLNEKNDDSQSLEMDRLVVSDRVWNRISAYLRIKDACWGRPWDGPFEWNQFVRNHNFDFLGVSGNAEVKLVDNGTILPYFFGVIDISSCISSLTVVLSMHRRSRDLEISPKLHACVVHGTDLQYQKRIMSWVFQSSGTRICGRIRRALFMFLQTERNRCISFRTPWMVAGKRRTLERRISRGTSPID
jgi:hypothetical protein